MQSISGTDTSIFIAGSIKVVDFVGPEKNSCCSGLKDICALVARILHTICFSVLSKGNSSE